MHTHTLPVSVGVGGFGPSHDNTETIGSNSAPEEESHQKREPTQCAALGPSLCAT